MDSLKKDEAAVADPPSKSNSKSDGGKSETVNATHESEKGNVHNSDDDFDDYEILFATVETSLTTE